MLMDELLAVVPRDLISVCCEWAFGSEYVGLTKHGHATEWNLRHSDIFRINKAADNPAASFERIGKAFMNHLEAT